MTRAFFLTTDTDDCTNHVNAWMQMDGCTGRHCSFSNAEPALSRQARDDAILAMAREMAGPDVIFYIGAVEGSGVPHRETFLKLRAMAPVVWLVSDAADHPWKRALRLYKEQQRMDLAVSIDGASKTQNPHIDISTLTPVDRQWWEPTRPKDIRFGFSGSGAGLSRRSEIIKALEWFGGLQVRQRGGEYADHCRWMSRVQILLNTSWTGTGAKHHIKGRVLEAAYAGCCLFEFAASPITDWLPFDTFIRWGNPVEAAEMARDLPDAVLLHTASRLREEVLSRYSAERIYGNILDAIHVDHSLAVTSAQHREAPVLGPPANL